MKDPMDLDLIREPNGIGYLQKKAYGMLSLMVGSVFWLVVLIVGFKMVKAFLAGEIL